MTNLMLRSAVRGASRSMAALRDGPQSLRAASRRRIGGLLRVRSIS
jgi:hypothetical protein